jgi:hypothetical protein
MASPTGRPFPEGTTDLPARSEFALFATQLAID